MQPKLKSEEILDNLIDSLTNGVSFTEIRLRGVLNDIEKNFSGIEKNYAKALAYSVAGNFDKAIDYFELSLQVRNIEYALNYMAVVNNNCSISKSEEVIDKLLLDYESRSLSQAAYGLAIFKINSEQAEEHNKTLVKLANDEDRMKLQKELDSASFAISKFKEFAGFNNGEETILSNIARNVIDESDVRLLGVKYITDSHHDESINSYIITVHCDDPIKVADMNMSMAFKLAEHDVLLDKKFSTIVQGFSQEAHGEVGQ